MHRIDGLHMECPFAGSRMLQGLPVQEGFKAGRLHVATLPLVTLLRNARDLLHASSLEKCMSCGWCEEGGPKSGQPEFLQHEM